jgi:hypothetical protein
LVESRKPPGLEIGKPGRPAAEERSKSNLFSRVLRRQQKPRTQSHVEKRFFRRCSEDVFSRWPGQSRRSNPGQEAEEPDFTRRHRLDRPKHGVRRRVDANLVELAELTDGNEIIQP